jgi:aryl-alcohol dehydrogenase-like predicted oxidoreductase
MALAWVLRDNVIASVLIGASSVEQVEQNVGAAEEGLLGGRVGADRQDSGVADQSW